MSFLSDIVTGLFGNEANDKAADAQVEASQRASDTQRYMFDQSMQYLQPSIYYGDQANALLASNYGFTPYGQSQQGQLQQLGQQYGGVNANTAAYMAQRPGLAEALQRDAARFSTDVDTLVQQHYSQHGQREGLQSPGVAGANYSASGQVPGTQGLTPQLPTGTPGQAGSRDMEWGTNPAPLTATPQSSGNPMYDNFQQSGEYKAMLETTPSDMARITGAMGSAGKAVSGSHIGALNQQNRSNTTQAYGMYANGLRAMAGQGQTAGSQAAGGQQALGSSIANNQMFAGNARASAYGNQYNWGNALASAENDAAKAMGFFG